MKTYIYVIFMLLFVPNTSKADIETPRIFKCQLENHEFYFKFYYGDRENKITIDNKLQEFFWNILLNTDETETYKSYVRVNIEKFNFYDQPEISILFDPIKLDLQQHKKYKFKIIDIFKGSTPGIILVTPMTKSSPNWITHTNFNQIDNIILESCSLTLYSSIDVNSNTKKLIQELKNELNINSYFQRERIINLSQNLKTKGILIFGLCDY